jgi:hypothetical protein
MPAAGSSMPDVDAIVIRLRLEHSNNGQGSSAPPRDADSVSYEAAVLEA